MGLKFTKSHGGFTFIELMVVMTIIGLLTIITLADYGLATNKARLQISAESLVSLLNAAKVDAQSNALQCVGVWVGEGRAPERWAMPWNVDAARCDFSSSEVSRSLQWSSRVTFDSMLWESISVTQTLVPHGDLKQVLFVFEPPEGILAVYDPDNLEKSLTEEGAYRVCMNFIYETSGDPVMEKAINVVPITSSFDILGTCDV